MSCSPSDQDRSTSTREEPRDVRLGLGTAWGVGGQFVGIGTSFLVGVLVARVLGVRGKGELAVVMQVISMMVVLFNLGVANANVYYVARGRLTPGTAVANSSVMAVLLGVLGAPIVAILLYSRFAVLPGIAPTAVAFAVLAVPLGLLAGWLIGVASGLGDLRLGFVYALVSSAVTLGMLGGLLFVQRLDVVTVVATSVAGTIAGMAALLLGLRRVLRPVRVDAQAARKMAGYSGKTYLASVAGYLHNRLDVLLLGWIAGAGPVGLYSIGVSLAEFVWYVPSALGGAILAKAPRSSDASAHDYVSRSTRVAMLFMIVISSLGALLVIPFIRAVYGSAFGPSALAFYLLLPGAIASGATRPAWSYFAARERIFWREALGAMALNVAMNLVLIPRIGFAGAAIASSISYTVLAAVVLVQFVRSTGMRMSALLVPTAADVRIAARTLRELSTAHSRRRRS